MRHFQVWLVFMTGLLSACAASEALQRGGDEAIAAPVSPQAFAPVYCPGDARALRDIYDVSASQVLVQVGQGEWPHMPPSAPGEPPLDRLQPSETVEDAVDRIGARQGGGLRFLLITEEEYQSQRRNTSPEAAANELWCAQDYSAPPVRGRPSPP